MGHGREELAKAAAAQMSELAYFSAYAGSSNIPAVQLAEKLISISYPNMQGVFFTCGGAESNESAFKTARFYWKAKGKPDKVKIIARQLAYHGVTLQAMSATGMSPYWKMFEPRVPDFVHIPTCYPYRQEGAKPGETAGQTAARLLEEAILREGADTVAAFIAEPIHGGGGVLYPTDDYFPLVRKICDKHQVLFIADEVITGFCRTGHWFALTHWNVLPDIMSFAKGVSSGYLPLGGIMVSKDDQGSHGLGQARRQVDARLHLLGASDLLRGRSQERRDHGARAARGALGHAGHAPAQEPARRFDSHPNVGDIRSGKGLLAAVELVEDKATKKPLARTEDRRAHHSGDEQAWRHHARPHGEHLLLAGAGHHRGAARPHGVRHPGSRQGRNRLLERRSSSPPLPLQRGRGQGEGVYRLPGTTQRYSVWVPWLLVTWSVWTGAQSPMSKLCETIRDPGRSSLSSLGRSRRLRSGER